MNVPTQSIVQQETIREKIKAIPSYLHDSYNETRKQLNNGVGFLKDNFTGFIIQAESSAKNILLPVNNFLKDLRQIEQEFEIELKKEQLAFGLGITQEDITGILLNDSPMEENY